MTWQQFLTEKVLKECWHEWRKYPEVGLQAKCSCGILFDVTTYNRADILYKHKNRTFDNRTDMMGLYEAIERDGKWEDFFWDFAFQRKPPDYGYGSLETATWLFCLSGEGYEDRCKMIAEFYGWEEKMGQYI